MEKITREAGDLEVTGLVQAVDKVAWGILLRVNFNGAAGSHCSRFEDFLCVPLCPLWLWHLHFINHKGTQRKNLMDFS
jgi:hypothetical protein